MNKNKRPQTAPVAVRRAEGGDCEQVVEILSEAFDGSPGLAWVYGTPEQYKRLAPAYFRWITRQALDAGVVYLVEGKGATLGLPSTALETSPEQVQATRRRLQEIGAERAEQLLTYEDTLRLHHPTQIAHWYSAYIGVRPAHAYRGIGLCLSHHFLKQHGDMPVYAESLLRNLAWCKRVWGFTSVGTFQMAGITHVQLWRNPSSPCPPSAAQPVPHR